MLLIVSTTIVSSTNPGCKFKKDVAKAKQAPSPPDICGPAEIPAGEPITICFWTDDPEGHDVSYYVEWGDGTSDGWTYYYPSGLEIAMSHTWDEIDENNVIRCKAKDIYNKESEWGYQSIPIV